MIELPEALTIGRQMDEELRGKRIDSAVHLSSPHKWAFHSCPPEETEPILRGRAMGAASGHGSMILVCVDPDYVLLLGGGGERILYHQTERTLPKKHQLLLHYDDGTYLTVSVQGWGSVDVLHHSEIADHRHVSRGISPLIDAFTLEHFERLFQEVGPEDKRSIKKFMISEPGILGVGNGYLQDILFRAKIHPRRRVVDITEGERRGLYVAGRETLRQAVDLGGRDTERDLYNNRGGYERILDSRTRGKPCPECGTPIEKIQYLGGASYFCPECQT
jgi:formamidopyrimidine-DNA glycosylase